MMYHAEEKLNIQHKPSLPTHPYTPTKKGERGKKRGETLIPR